MLVATCAWDVPTSGVRLRISLAMTPVGLFGWGLFSTPQPPWGVVLSMGVFASLFYTAFFAAAYLAIEPTVRRRRPEWLASWTRLIGGRPLDPLVGRDLMIGLAAGATLCIAAGLRGILTGSAPYGDLQAAAVGGLPAVAVVLRGIGSGVFNAVLSVLILVLLEMLFRREWLSWLAWGLCVTATNAFGFPDVIPWGLVFAVFAAVVWGVTLQRAGLLGLAVAYATYAIFNEEYLTANLRAWYAGVSIAGLFAMGSLLAWGWVASLRGARAEREPT